MATRTVNTNQLTPQKTMMIRGKLTYSRLTRQVDGEELQKDMQRRASRRMNPIDKPYTTATICNAQVLYMDPNNKTPEEIYAEESLYQSQTQGSTGWCFSGVNKGKTLPYIAIKDGNTARQIAPEGELAAGLDVTLVLRVFHTQMNNGVTLDGVIVNEPIRYYGGGVGAGLNEHGITFQPCSQEELKAAEEKAKTAPTMPVPDANVQTPQAQPVSAPTGNPYSVQNNNGFVGQPAMPQAQPVAPTAAPQNYAQPPMNPPFQPNNNGNGMSNAGIAYDPNSRY